MILRVCQIRPTQQIGKGKTAFVVKKVDPFPVGCRYHVHLTAEDGRRWCFDRESVVEIEE